ncbi:hypothetical protein P5G65_23700 [Paenibacillus chondroitinus]|uniref:FAD/FMN-containing dehydrogenase n=1 Tax=Paenibacillus chondroitinus TaxID=59842 RepID=A0ABU6DGN1_9BACL|nr:MULTISPECIES: hypothetical protein [Paenibacillus]MCY9659514.1 hypothetical protein [Paenibacillus anseongense]MEB4796909.1 hypothetical protein [Paenibacillus chondroitinus]
MKKKTIFIASFALLAVLAVGQIGFAAGTKDKDGQDNTSKGMYEMMQNGNMDKMMQSMHSPEGEKMMKACDEFMDSNEKTNGKPAEKMSL